MSFNRFLYTSSLALGLFAMGLLLNGAGGLQCSVWMFVAIPVLIWSMIRIEQGKDKTSAGYEVFLAFAWMTGLCAEFLLGWIWWIPVGQLVYFLVVDIIDWLKK